MSRSCGRGGGRKARGGPRRPGETGLLGGSSAVFGHFSHVFWRFFHDFRGFSTVFRHVLMISMGQGRLHDAALRMAPHLGGRPGRGGSLWLAPGLMASHHI